MDCLLLQLITIQLLTNCTVSLNSNTSIQKFNSFTTFSLLINGHLAIELPCFDTLSLHTFFLSFESLVSLCTASPLLYLMAFYAVSRSVEYGHH